MNVEEDAKMEILKCFFHNTEQSNLEKICNSLLGYARQLEPPDKTLNDFIEHLKSFINLRFKSSDYSFKLSCNNYRFYDTFFQMGYNSINFFDSNLVKLNTCLLQIEKGLNNENVSLDAETSSNIRTFINQFFVLEKNFFHFFEEFKKISADVSRLNIDFNTAFNKSLLDGNTISSSNAEKTY